MYVCVCNNLKGRWYIIKLRKIKEKRTVLTVLVNQPISGSSSLPFCFSSSAQAKYPWSFTSLACHTKGNTHGSVRFIIAYFLFYTKILMKLVF